MKHTKRLISLLLAFMLVLAAPAAAFAQEGGAVAVDEFALSDDFESIQLDLWSYESSAKGDGSLYNTMTARQKACYNALLNISFQQIMASADHSVPVNINGINNMSLNGYNSGGHFVASGSSVSVYNSVQNDLIAAIAALRYDRPDLMWLDQSVYTQLSFRGNGSRYTISAVRYRFSMPYNGQENNMRSRMMTEVNNIAREAGREADTYHKVKKAHDLIAARARYNYTPGSQMEGQLSHSAYSALIAGDAYEPVCDGYSKALKLVLNTMDIPCVLAVSKDHMWNNVKMDDGLWYNVDLTWDDGRGASDTTYFLVGSGTRINGVPFSQQPDHVERDPFNENSVSGARYPKKNTEAYRYIGSDYAPTTYRDVPRSDSAYEDIEYVTELGYFSGSKGYFQPDKNITRAEFAKVLAGVLGVNPKEYDGRYSFGDVSTAAWYSGVAFWAKDSGIMTGDTRNGQKVFRPDDPISREEMCVVLVRALNLSGEGDKVFADDGKISPWAKEQVYLCVGAGLIRGGSGNRFNPSGRTIRRDAARVFARYARSLEAAAA